MTMQIHCPSCDTQVQSEDMNLANMVAKCRKCNALINLKDYLPAETRPVHSAKRLRVPEPRGIRVDDSGDALRLTWRWFSGGYVFLAIFCVAWDSFLVFWYTMALTKGAPWIMIVFPVIHLAVGVGLTYTVLAGFLNRTIMLVDSENISVHHGPIPWPGNCRVPISDVQQLFVEEQTKSGRRSSTTVYEVNAATKEGKKLTLLSTLDRRDHARFVEQRIEQFLKIDDQEIAGEM